MDFASITKNQLYHTIKRQSEGLEKHRDCALSFPTLPHDIASSLGTEMTCL